MAGLLSTAVTAASNTVSGLVNSAVPGLVNQGASAAATKAHEALGAVGSAVGSVVAEAGKNLPNPFSSLLAGAGKSASGLTSGAPTLGSVSEIRTQLPSSATTATNSDNYKLILTDTTEKDKAKRKRVVFEVMPQITEQRAVQYDQVQPPQLPGAFQKYKGTDPVRWSIQAKLISRNSQEALDNLNRLNTLRGWTMPFFSERTGEKIPNSLGAPPAVLELSGLRFRTIGPVPVVITGLNWTWPPDVDYLPCGTITGDTITWEIDPDSQQPIPFPAVMDISVEVVESLAISEFNRFDITAYHKGLMRLAYGSGPNVTTVSEAGVASDEVQPDSAPPNQSPVDQADTADFNGFI
jgi:hypothetical protein